MAIKYENPLIYECDKCKCEGVGGFNSNLFDFYHGGRKAELCRPCYTDYLQGLDKLEEDYVKCFFEEK